MYKILQNLEGRKTYTIAAITALINLAVAFGWISPDHLEQINMVLVAFGGAALRAGINKV